MGPSAVGLQAPCLLLTIVVFIALFSSRCGRGGGGVGKQGGRELTETAVSLCVYKQRRWQVAQFA